MPATKVTTRAPEEHRFKVYTAGQKRPMTDAIKREMRRRATIELVIGNAKSEHRMGRNCLAHRAGMRSTPYSPPWATTSAASWPGSVLLSVVWTVLTALGRSQTVAAAT